VKRAFKYARRKGSVFFDGAEDNFVDGHLVVFLRLRKTDAAQCPTLLFRLRFPGLPGSLLFALFFSNLCGRPSLALVDFLSVEKLLLGSASLGLLLSSSLEVVVVVFLIQLEIAEVNLGRSRDDVTLVDATKRNTIQPERTSDHEKAGIQLFQKDDPLALVSTGEDDQNGSRSDGFPQTSLSVMWSPLDLVSNRFLGVISGGFGQDGSFFAFLAKVFNFGLSLLSSIRRAGRAYAIPIGFLDILSGVLVQAPNQKRVSEDSWH